MLTVLIGPFMTTSAKAAPPTFVNVCTGLGITFPALQPVASATDGVLGGVLDTVLNPVIGDVNVNLQQALSGKAIGLGVLDPATNTFVSVPASQCNITANTFTSTNNNGISIGGGQVTGLGGASGGLSSAGDPSAIAFGNGAATAAGATGAVAIGTGAAANQAGAVALGAGSMALRGSLANYSAFGLSTAQSSSGEVSIGTSSAQRQITNLAPGQAATDGVNVAQLSGAAGNLGTSLKTIIGGGATYDSTTGKVTAPTFTVQGGSYTTIGSAFDAVDTALSAGAAGPFASDNTAAAARPSATGANATAGGYGASAQGSGSLVLGNAAKDNAVANSVVLGNGASVASGLGGSNVVIGQGSSGLRGSLAGYSAFGLAASQTSSGEVSIGTSGAQRQITNLAAGQAPTDGVNVAQLTGAAGSLGTSLKTIIGAGATYDSTTGRVTAPTFTVQGGSYTSIGSAFDAVDTALSAGGGGGGSGPFASDNTAAAALPSATGTNATAGGYGASALGNRSLVLGNAAKDNAVANSVVLGNGASVGSGLAGSNIVLGQGSAALRGSLAGYSAFGLAASQTSSGEVSIGTSGAQRQITNLAAGQAPTDGVNVAQLTGAAGNLGTSLKTIIGAGATYDSTTGRVTAPTFTVQGGSYTTIGSAFDAVDTALSAGGGGGSGPFASDNTAAAALPSASGANATAGGYGASAQGSGSLVLGNAAKDNAVANSVVLGNGASVAPGLAGSNVVLGQGSTAARGALAGYAAFGLAPSQTSAGEVSLGTSSARRQITNLAAGQSATDAVNVAQLTGATGNLGTSLKTIIGAGATYNATTGTVTAPTFTVQGGSYTTIGSAFDAVDTALTSGAGGGGAKAFASDNTAAAPLASATGADATAGGYGASAHGKASLVLGNSASDNSVANSVVLGKGASVTAGLAGSNVVIGQGAVDLRGSLSGYTAFGLAAPDTSAGELSVGSSSARRQITNVAAGQAATDAVNVAQLSGAAGHLGTSLKTIIGGGAGYDSTSGTVTTPSFTVGKATYSTIGSALAALNSSVGDPAVEYSTAAAPTTPNPGVASSDVTLVGAARVRSPCTMSLPAGSAPGRRTRSTAAKSMPATRASPPSSAAAPPTTRRPAPSPIRTT